MARKQPHEIKDDYREVEKITDETEQFMEGYPVNIIDNDGNKRTLKTPFVDTTKGNELLEKNMEMNGVMKDNLKTYLPSRHRFQNPINHYHDTTHHGRRYLDSLILNQLPPF